MRTSLALRTTHPRTPRVALWLSSAGLEATYLYAWAAFGLTMVSNQRYSALLAVCTFGGASVVSRALLPTRPRRREVALVHAAGLTLVSLLSIHHLIYPGVALWRMSWIVQLLMSAKSAQTYLTIAFALFFGWAFWRAGFRHGCTPSSYERVCARFDRGILWLGSLFALKLLWRGQRDANLDDGVTGALIAPYFLFAIVALASARNRGMGAKSLIGGYRGLGRLADLSLGGMLATLACVLLLLPELRALAHVSYESLRELGGPLANVFAVLLYLLFGLWVLLTKPRGETAQTLKEQFVRTDPKPEYRNSAILPAHDLPEWMAWICVGVLLASAVIGGCYVAWQLRGGAVQSSFFADLWRWVKRAWLAVRDRVAKALTASPPQPEPVRIYLALLQWGRRSGSPHRPSETPLEYACRLKRRMPALSAEVELIAASYSAHAYGPRAKPEWSDEKAALRRLQSLRLWPQRFRLWLTGDADVANSPHGVQGRIVADC